MSEVSEVNEHSWEVVVSSTFCYSTQDGVYDGSRVVHTGVLRGLTGVLDVFLPSQKE